MKILVAEDDAVACAVLRQAPSRVGHEIKAAGEKNLPMEESIKRLEEKIAYLERHVTEQDKAMLGLADELAALRREMKNWRERTLSGGADGSAGGEMPQDERPPHY